MNADNIKRWRGAPCVWRNISCADSGLRFVFALLALTTPLVGLNVPAESAQQVSEASRSEEVVKSTGSPDPKEPTAQLLEKGAPTKAAAKGPASKQAVEPGPTHQVGGVQHATRHSGGQPLLNDQNKNAKPSLPLPSIHTPAVNPKEGLPVNPLKPQASQMTQPAVRRISVPTADAFHNRNTAPTGIGGPSKITKNREMLTGLNGTEIKRKP